MDADAVSEKSIQAVEKTVRGNVSSKINFLVGLQEPLLTTVERQRLARCEHVMRYNGQCKTILQGTLRGRRRRARQRKCRMNNVKEWTSLSMPELPTMASRRKD